MDVGAKWSRILGTWEGRYWFVLIGKVGWSIGHQRQFLIWELIFFPMSSDVDVTVTWLVVRLAHSKGVVKSRNETAARCYHGDDIECETLPAIELQRLTRTDIALIVLSFH